MPFRCVCRLPGLWLQSFGVLPCACSHLMEKATRRPKSRYVKALRPRDRSLHIVDRLRTSCHDSPSEEYCLLFVTISFSADPTLNAVPIATANELPELLIDRLWHRRIFHAVHAFVWLNWQLVEPQRLRPYWDYRGYVNELAVSMGLPRNVCIPREMRAGLHHAGSRTWHLLPYRSTHSFALGLTPRNSRSDSAKRCLYIKLGSSKPRWRSTGIQRAR